LERRLGLRLPITVVVDGTRSSPRTAWNDRQSDADIYLFIYLLTNRTKIRRFKNKLIATLKYMQLVDYKCGHLPLPTVIQYI
jgi:hypothetical protein